jgi:flagellar motor switch protein FliG
MGDADLMAPAGVDKAAILLLTLGPEAAAGVFRHLSEAEAREVSAAIARIRSIPGESAAVVHEEAWRRLVGQDRLLVDGERFARDLVPGEPASEREDDLVAPDGDEFVARRFAAVPPGALAELLADEHPQTLALVVAHLPARTAADVLAQLPESVQPDVVRRVADLQRVPAGVLADVGDVLHGRVKGVRAPESPGSRARLAAQILNAAPAAVGERVFAHLAVVAPELGETIRDLMLGFDDLVRLDGRAMQTVLQEIPRAELILALTTARAPVRAHVLASLSPRIAHVLQDELSTMGPVPARDVLTAQAGIVAVVRRLEAEGRIALGPADGVR